MCVCICVQVCAAGKLRTPPLPARRASSDSAAKCRRWEFPEEFPELMDDAEDNRASYGQREDEREIQFEVRAETLNGLEISLFAEVDGALTRHGSRMTRTLYGTKAARDEIEYAASREDWYPSSGQKEGRVQSRLHYLGGY